MSLPFEQRGKERTIMLKTSALLDYLVACADQLKEADGKRSLSVDYFLASVLQTMLDRAAGRLPEPINNEGSLRELEEVASLLGGDLDLEESVKGLLSSIRAEGYSSLGAELAFGKLNYMAEEKARAMNKEVVDASVFVTMILAEPTAAIRRWVPLGQAPQVPSPAEDADQELSALFRALKKELEEKKPSQQEKAEEEAKPQKPEAPEAPEDAGVGGLVRTVGDTGSIQSTLLECVFGQDTAINTFVSGYFESELMARMGRNGRKPKATFLFAGPPGVGKTFLAEKSAEALKLPFMRFDMSEYSDKEAIFEFCGSDEVYKNSKPGNVTKFVSENPRCVLLFDEIEKAHINIIHLFLQILDAGRVRDNHTDKEVSFSEAIIILTTNAGKNLYEDTTVTNLSSLPRKSILKALATDVNPETKIPLFPAAICSRFASGNVVMFNHLGVNNLFTIAERELKTNLVGFERTTGIKLEVDEKIPTALILSEGGKADARTVKGRANTFFHEELYELFRLLAADPEVVARLKTIKLTVALEGENPDIARMFLNRQTPEVLVFAEPEKFRSVTEAARGVIFHVTDDIERAKDILFNHDISIILCDIYCHPEAKERDLLNAEDTVSRGRDFLFHALSRYAAPVHLLQAEGEELSREEFLSFAKRGVEDALTVTGAEAFEKRVLEKCHIAYQQGNIQRLARENKVLSYKSAQRMSKDGTEAEISLCELKLSLAADLDDSKSILDRVSKPAVRFPDVIGAEDAKRELAYFVEYLKNPVKYIRKGVRAPKGVLLYGPPGTGKTMLAKAMAGESDVTFLTAEGNQFLKRYVGEGSEAVHDLFRAARKYAPSILFIDEIDAIGKDRKGSSSDNTGDVLTAFLTEMDGFNTDTTKPVFVLAATNYDVEPGGSRSLDPALLRRFDRRIYVDLPTKDERKRFLHQKASGSQLISLSAEQIENIAVRSTGMSLAELDSVYEMALRGALCKEGGIVDDAAFEEAFETFNSGEKKQWSQSSLERTARHEAGHALLYWLGGETPSYLTIVARGDHGGYMQHGDSEGKGLYTRAELLSLIRTSLAGRAAEIVYYGREDGISTGPSGDLCSATRVAEQMLTRYGMDEELGLSYLEESDKESAYYERVRARVNEILAREMERSIEIVSANRAAVDRLVAALLEKNHLKEKEIKELLEAK